MHRLEVTSLYGYQRKAAVRAAAVFTHHGEDTRFELCISSGKMVQMRVA